MGKSAYYMENKMAKTNFPIAILANLDRTWLLYNFDIEYSHAFNFYGFIEYILDNISSDTY